MPQTLPRAARANRQKILVSLMLTASAVAFAACASATQGSPASQPTSAGTGGSAGTVVGAPAQSSSRWLVKTAPYVDLWLHSFAMLAPDTSPVPLFKRGYRDSIIAIKNRSNVLTSLDANRETLAKRLRTNPALVQAQFLALAFNSFAELKHASDVFLQYQGEPQRAPDAATQNVVAQLASVFPAAADREWLRLFMSGVVDEQSRFYDAEYQRATRARSAVLAAVDAVWHKQYFPKFERFLNNTSQRQGELLVSLPLGPEGRTSVGAERQTIMAVPFPGRAADAVEVVLVVAHEAVGNIVSGVVADNTTPAQQRSGEAGNFVAFGQVQAGLLLLQKVAPDLMEPYARYYLAQGGKNVPATNAVAALKNAYPLPQALIDGLARQIEIVLAGI